MPNRGRPCRTNSRAALRSKEWQHRQASEFASSDIILRQKLDIRRAPIPTLPKAQARRGGRLHPHAVHPAEPGSRVSAEADCRLPRVCLDLFGQRRQCRSIDCNRRKTVAACGSCAAESRNIALPRVRRRRLLLCAAKLPDIPRALSLHSFRLSAFTPSPNS